MSGVGVISSNPAFIGGVEGTDKVLVGLVGQLPLKVSSENGPIHPRDAISTSSIPGVGSKATKAGYIVGKALTSYNNTNPDDIGQIDIYVNAGWYDPLVRPGCVSHRHR